MSDEEIFERLRQGVLTQDANMTRKAAEEAVVKCLDPVKALTSLSEAGKELGQKFENMEIFLVELMKGAEALKAGTEVLVTKIPKGVSINVGTVLIGTVKGDIHDIGKKIVITMLEAAGFKTHDLGVDVPPPRFVEEAERLKPDIVAASAIMTTTTPMQKDLIEYFTALEMKDDYIMMVGGGAVTRQYADEIGADGYGFDCMEAVKVASDLVAKKKKYR